MRVNPFWRETPPEVAVAGGGRIAVNIAKAKTGPAITKAGNGGRFCDEHRLFVARSIP